MFGLVIHVNVLPSVFGPEAQPRVNFPPYDRKTHGHPGLGIAGIAGIQVVGIKDLAPQLRSSSSCQREIITR